jgi:hypothetical protein
MARRRRALVAVALLAVACRGDGRTPTAPAESPAPAPESPAAVVGCGLPPSGPFQRCPRELPFFAFDVNEAIAEVQNEVPELFDFADWLGGLSYRVLDRERYHLEVAARLERMGFCAVWDGQEIGIKNTNAFNEQYQVMTSMGYVRWGGGAYRSTCFPAWF